MKKTHDHVDCEDGTEIYAIVKKPRVEVKGKGYKGINNSRIDPVNAEIKDEYEAESRISGRERGWRSFKRQDLN